MCILQYLERLGDARQISYFILSCFSGVDEAFLAVLEKRSPQRRTRIEIRICVYKNIDFSSCFNCFRFSYCFAAGKFCFTSKSLKFENHKNLHSLNKETCCVRTGLRVRTGKSLGNSKIKIKMTNSNEKKMHSF